MVKGLGIGERLRKLRKNHSLSQARVAEKLFVSQAAYSFMESSQHGLSSEHTIQLCRFYNITADYLLMGHQNLIEMTTKNGFLPLLNEKIHAGILKYVDHLNLEEGLEYYRIPDYHPTADSILIQIVQNGMQPSIMPGDILICQRQRHLDYLLNGSIAVVITEEGLYTKRIFRHADPSYLWLENDSPEDGEKIKIKKSDIKRVFLILGKVSNVLIPHQEMAFKGKINSLQESLDALGIEVYKMSKIINRAVSK